MTSPPTRQTWDLIVVIDGDPPRPGWRVLLDAGATVIAADGGARFALDEGVRVDWCVGDLDSISQVDLAQIERDGATIVRHPREKDDTDFALALKFGVGQGERADDQRRLLVVGGAGGRLDHELGNLAVLSGHDAAQFAVTALLGDTLVQVATPARSITPFAQSGEIVSLVPIGGSAHGVTTSGLRYGLDGEDLAWGSSRGISNVVDTPPASVSVASGTVLVCEPESVEKLIDTNQRRNLMIVEIQCLPKPSGIDGEPYAFVHAAIEVIEQSGLAYEVGPCGTSVEGPPDELWSLLRQVHESTMDAGASGCMSIVKVFEQRGADQVTMTSLTDRYRS